MITIRDEPPGDYQHVRAVTVCDMSDTRHALLVGNSDGIGLAVTRKLLHEGYCVTGISRSTSPMSHTRYTHIVQDVSSQEYPATLAGVMDRIPSLDLCIYCAGIGELLDWQDLSTQTKVFQVNLMGAVTTTELVLTKFCQQRYGHFIGLSSVADMCISPEAPSYSASKVGVSWFWEGLGLRNTNSQIHISNIRFGFVDTKMAKSTLKPFMLSIEEAASFVLNVVRSPRLRATKPRRIVPIVWILQLVNRIRITFR